MNKKQLLIKGFEIGLNSKDTVHTQMQLAEMLSEIKETETSVGLCHNCKFGKGGFCDYQNQNTGVYPYTTFDTFGMCNYVKTCDKYEEK